MNVFYLDAKQRYEHRKVDPMRPLLPPELLWLSIDAVNHALKITPKINFKAGKVRFICSSENLAVSLLPAVTIQSQQKEPLSQLRRFIEHFKGNVLFSVVEKLKDFLKLYWNLLSPLKIKPN